MEFQEFLDMCVPEENHQEVKKFSSNFFAMHNYSGAVPVITVGFSFGFHDEDFPEEKYWQETQEIVKLFKPINAWIGTKENREFFKKEYPQITVEPYSFFEDGGFFPISVIPMKMYGLVPTD